MKMAGFMDTHIKMSLLSTKRGVFVDGDGKMSLPSMKMAVFVDGSGIFVIFAWFKAIEYERS